MASRRLDPCYRATHNESRQQIYGLRPSLEPKLPLLIDHTKMTAIITHFVTSFESVMSLLTNINHDL
jgi:hypothetical protein